MSTTEGRLQIESHEMGFGHSRYHEMGFWVIKEEKGFWVIEILNKANGDKN